MRIPSACPPADVSFLDKDYRAISFTRRVQDPAFVEEMKEQLKIARAGGLLRRRPRRTSKSSKPVTRRDPANSGRDGGLRKEVADGISGAFAHEDGRRAHDQRGTTRSRTR